MRPNPAADIRVVKARVAKAPQQVKQEWSKQNIEAYTAKVKRCEIHDLMK
jgi:hypothetical protein